MNETILHELTTKVYIDADIMIDMGKPPGDWVFRRLVDLVNVGVISIVSPDLTMGQVVRHHVRDAYKTLDPLRQTQFRNVYSSLFNVNLSQMSNASLRSKLETHYQAGISEMFRQLNAEMLDLDVVVPSVIFDDYMNGSGFFDPNNKPNQFADAFIFAALLEHRQNGEPLIIVARDKDFDEPAKEVSNVAVLKKIEDLFAWFALEVGAPDIPAIQGFLQNALMSNELFRSAVAFEDFEIDQRWLLNSRFDGIRVENISAFKLFHDHIMIAMVDTEVSMTIDVAKVELGDPSSVDETEAAQTSGTAKVEFFGAISIDENGIPLEIEEVSLRTYEVRLNPPVGSIFGMRFLQGGH